MTFYEPTRKFPVAAVIILLIIGGVGTTIFFSLKECKSSGILRSGKTSDATELYQIFPYTDNGRNLLISLEGVFKTRIYERQGGITTRSGSTDIRISVHDLKNGEELNRLVLGDYHDSYSKILGITKNQIWIYNAAEGLHSRNISDLKIKTGEKSIVAANSDLAEGIAKADQYLNNVNELFGFNKEANSIMVTTISGNKIWIDASTFKTMQPATPEPEPSDIEDVVENIMERAMNGEEVDMNELTNKIIEMASDLSAFSDIEHESDRITGFDSCEYKLNGQTVKTIERSNCPQPKKIASNSNNSNQFIEPAFLSYYSDVTKHYTNPDFLGTKFCVFHSKSIGSNTDLMMSLVNIETMKPEWTIPTGIKLDNERSSYQVNGSFGGSDTLFISIENYLYALNLSNGKIIWKTQIMKGEYDEQLYFLGESFENGKRYFISANSYFTELGREGIFVHGRTDYRLNVIDAANGKIVKKTDATNSNTDDLPYYIGMANNMSWFYSVNEGIHSRSIPDLTVSGSPFKQVLSKNNVTSPLVKTDRYGDPFENKYVAFSDKNGSVYFTTEDGSHYQYKLAGGNISAINAPSDEMYESMMKENQHVKYFRERLWNLYHHELYFRDGRSIEVKNDQSTATLKLVPKPSEGNVESVTALNQFIEGQFLVNGVNLTGRSFLTESNRTPVTTSGDNGIYVFHKDKISPDAHKMISKYDVEAEKLIWKIDITNLLMTDGEIERIYTAGDQLIIIFKTHPDLDDFFTCVSVNASTGKIAWNFKF